MKMSRISNQPHLQTMMIIKRQRSKRRVNLQATSAQTVASIDDLLKLILLLLPVKTLIRFKSVSKHWHSLITNPEFRRLRHPNPNPALGLLFPSKNFCVINPTLEFVRFTHSTSTPPLTKLNFTRDRYGIRILQSCNGLLLCSSHRPHVINRRYYVYNPTTRQFTTLPKSDCGNGRVRGMSLAFDPALSPHYKVVCVRSFEMESGEIQNQIEIYSSDAGPWRLSGEPFAEEVDFEKGVYWNGSIHWIYEGPDGHHLYFDVHNESLVTKPMPPIPDGSKINNYYYFGRIRYYFGESCGHLHYIEIIGPTVEFVVHEMKRDCSEWFVKYRVDLSPVAVAFPGMIRDGFHPLDWYHQAYSIFCIVRGQEEDESFLILQIPGKVIKYNLVYKTFELVHEFKVAEDAEVDDDPLTFPYERGFQYIESLCCV